MISQWVNWINCVIGGLIVCFLLWTGLLWIGRPGEIVHGELKPNHSRLPKGAFELPAESYAQIDNSLLNLQSAPPTLQVPDLKSQLVYYGKNGRPDAQRGNTNLHFSFNGSKEVVSYFPGEKIYLVYDKKGGPSKYIFSPSNQKTSLWFVATPTDTSDVAINVSMEDEKGEIINEPKSAAEFTLPEKEFIRYAGITWEIGAWRVDGTILSRMRARWYGPDRFLEKHGGLQYANVLGKQRIDFGENDDVYSVFVEVGDCLIWDPVISRWRAVQPGPDSLKYPLLVVKKMEDRLMTMELWDVEGKGKISLNVLKSTEPMMGAGAMNIQHQFKFVGARTKSQCVFEINKERVVLSPSDWLLLTPQGWKKLTTEAEIDDYVNRKTSGSLFVFEGLKRHDEKQVLSGMLYNTSRCESQEIELPLQPVSNGPAKPSSSDSKKDKEKDKDKANEMIETIKEKMQNSLRPQGEGAPHSPQVPSQMPRNKSFNP